MTNDEWTNRSVHGLFRLLPADRLKQIEAALIADLEARPTRGVDRRLFRRPSRASSLPFALSAAHLVGQQGWRALSELQKLAVFVPLAATIALLAFLAGPSNEAGREVRAIQRAVFAKRFRSLAADHDSHISTSARIRVYPAWSGLLPNRHDVRHPRCIPLFTAIAPRRRAVTSAYRCDGWRLGRLSWLGSPRNPLPQFERLSHCGVACFRDLGMCCRGFNCFQRDFSALDIESLTRVAADPDTRKVRTTKESKIMKISKSSLVLTAAFTGLLGGTVARAATFGKRQRVGRRTHFREFRHQPHRWASRGRQGGKARL